MTMEMPTTLFSTASNKGEMFKHVAGLIGWDPALLNQRAPQGEIIEMNDWKSTIDLFLNKMQQTWVLSQFTLADGEVGLVNDVTPKGKSRDEKSYVHRLTNNKARLNDQTHLTLDQKGKLVADHLFESYAEIDRSKPLDVRITSGVGIFLSNALLGLVTQKHYIHYPRHPFGSIKEAKHYVDFAREHNVDIHGNPDNLTYNRSAAAAGSSLHLPMIAWFVETFREPVYIDSYSSDPLVTTNQLGSGFTPDILIKVGSLTERRSVPRAKSVLAGTRRLDPDTRYKIVWSPREHVLVHENVGSSSVAL